MEKLCYGTYAKILQSVMQPPNGNQETTELLLGYIIETGDVRNKKGGPLHISPKMTTGLFKFQDNVHQGIREASMLLVVINRVYAHFDKKIVAFLNPHTEHVLLPSMTKLIENDGSIDESKKQLLLGKTKSDQISEFLADTFLYAINRPNRREGVSKHNNQSVNIKRVIGELSGILAKLPPLQPVEVPESVDPAEMIYVKELLEAYAEAKNVPVLTKESLSQYPGYQQNFQRQRKDYYAAEAVRRGTRDAFQESDTDHFGVLKDETYDGIIDVHSQDYAHGYERLTAVMSHATLLPVDKCLLSRVPSWIGNSEKKGVCHVLVNEGRFRWVMSDE